MDSKWYHVCWPRLIAKRVEPVVSINWASCSYFWAAYTCLWFFRFCKTTDFATISHFNLHTFMTLCWKLHACNHKCTIVHFLTANKMDYMYNRLACGEIIFFTTIVAASEKLRRVPWGFRQQGWSTPRVRYQRRCTATVRHLIGIGVRSAEIETVIDIATPRRRRRLKSFENWSLLYEVVSALSCLHTLACKGLV